MIGAITGDTIGSVYEFNNIKTTDFPLFTTGSSYTDDTICTVAIADAILRTEGIPGVSDFQKSLLYWCRRYPHPKGAYGASFYKWINSRNPQPYNSFGNGAAMRVSPVAWAFDTLPAVLEAAKRSAAVTHDHPEGIKGAQAIAHAIFMLRNGNDKADVIENISAVYEYNLCQSVDFIRKNNNFDETCQVTVPQALICFKESVDFESAIRMAVSIGGDSDTIAAITGSLAEAYYKGVPVNMSKPVLDALPKDMQSIVDLFHAVWLNNK